MQDVKSMSLVIVQVVRVVKYCKVVCKGSIPVLVKYSQSCNLYYAVLVKYLQQKYV